MGIQSESNQGKIFSGKKGKKKIQSESNMNPMNFLSFLGFPGEALVPSEARAHSVGVDESHLLRVGV